MAATFRPNWAYDYVSEYIKHINLDRVKLRALQDVCTEMWMAAPWRWTLGALPVVTLATNTQDYTVILPSDFLFADIVYMTNGKEAKTLEVVPVLPSSTDLYGTPSQVAVTGTAGGGGTMRFMNPPGDLAETWKVISLYKKQAPVLTQQKLDQAGVLGFDDEWAWVFNAGVLHYGYMYSDDPRAGSISVDDSSGKVAYTGQLAKYRAAIQTMRECEKLPDVALRFSPTPKKEKG